MLLRRGHCAGNRTGHVCQEAVQAIIVGAGEVSRSLWCCFLLGCVEEAENPGQIEAVTATAMTAPAVSAECLERFLQVLEDDGCEGGDLVAVCCGGGYTAARLAGGHYVLISRWGGHCV